MAGSSRSVNCPNCGRNLVELVGVRTGTLIEYIGRGGNVRIEADTYFNPDGKLSDYLCPFCYESITTDESQAWNIVEGKSDSSVGKGHI